MLHIQEASASATRPDVVLTSQVEELVAGSNTGKAPQLCDYYSYWEMAVFNALVLMVLKGLEKLHSMLTKMSLFKASRSCCKGQASPLPPSITEGTPTSRVAQCCAGM